MKLNLFLVALLSCAIFHGRANEYRASSATDIARLSATLKPGDVVLLSNGEWKNQELVFAGNGAADKPISFRAETFGKVVLSGKSSVVITGEHLVVSGVFLDNGQLEGGGVRISGNNCRFTESAVEGGRYKFFVHLFGASNRVDHCYLAGKTNDSPTLQIEVEGAPNFHRVDHNHFGPRPPLRRNGGETIRVGYSHQSMTNSATTVERNLFDRCDGEIEIISNKSCENIYRFNTFLDCAGMLTLRHGNRCVVEGNFFIGNQKRGSGGIRVIGENHTIINNYIEGVREGGFWITAGIPDSELKGYFQARDCLIAFNTFVNSRGPAVQLDAGFGSSSRTLRPENITFANNIFAVNEGTVLKGREGAGYKWIGNVVSGSEFSEQDGIKNVDPKLQRAEDGLWHPSSDSPVRGAARGNFSQIKMDIDGQLRREKTDVGCDQVSTEPITNRPLTAADVGPSWMRSR